MTGAQCIAVNGDKHGFTVCKINHKVYAKLVNHREKTLAVRLSSNEANQLSDFQNRVPYAKISADMPMTLNNVSAGLDTVVTIFIYSQPESRPYLFTKS